MTKKRLQFIPLLIFFIIPLLGSCHKSQSEIPVKKGYALINGTEIYYKRIGAGEPIIIVHGGPVLEHDYPILNPDEPEPTN